MGKLPYSNKNRIWGKGNTYSMLVEVYTDITSIEIVMEISQKD